LQTIQTSLGLPYRPDCCSRDPAADGVVGQATADVASFLDMGLCLPGSGSRGRPWVQYRNGGKPAEMLIRYHRDVSAASRTEPRSNPIWEAVRSQAIAGVNCLAVGRPLPAGRAAFRAHWGGRPTTTSGDTKWRPSAGAADEHRHIASGAVSRSCADSGRRASSIVQHRAVGAPLQPYP
jgi:hypothetical protein